MKKLNQKYIPYIVGALVTLLLVTGIYISRYDQKIYVTYQAFLEILEKHQVKQVEIGEESTFIFEKIGDSTVYKTDNPRTEDFKKMLLENNIKVIEDNSVENFTVVQYIVSMVLFIGSFYIVFKSIQNRGMQGNAMTLQTKPITPEELKVGFSDIAGNREAKEQVEDIIQFIKNPVQYTAIGAKMPKGLIFYGPPGTGKTLMAKAIAKEAGVPFFSVSGSDFVQMYVGVGASRIRELFKEARKHEKAVIFIDEIDAMGKKRSQNPTNSNDEKDQTLNALLTEMSGFKSDDGIVVIAATNRLELLDDALLRPGRFDRHIEIGYPDKNAREQIIRHYLKNKPIDESVDVKKLVKQTVYFTGAMLEHLLNEAAIIAANDKKKAISVKHIDQAFYTVVAGAEKKDRSYISQEERFITAYHEAGHALVTKLVAPENTVAKVTIIPTVKGAGGFSMNIPKDKMYQTKQDLMNHIKISLAGRIAEELIFGKDFITTGASNDIEKATLYLKDLIGKYGMDEEIGFLNMEVLGIGQEGKNGEYLTLYKEKMKELYETTKALMESHRGQLDKLANLLLEHETLDEEMIHEVVLTS